MGDVEAMGHEYEHLMEGAMDEGGESVEADDIPKETALMVANQAILDRSLPKEELGEQLEEGEEGDDDG